MRTDQPVSVRLADYRPPAFLVDEADLAFALAPSATRVRSTLKLRRNGPAGEPLRLDGVRLKPISFAIDGRRLEPGAYEITDEQLVVPNVPDTFELTTEVEIDPAGNSAL